MDPSLDPTTGDYAAGLINTLANAVYLRLMTPLGSYWADPSLGSRLGELARQKDLARVAVLAQQYAAQALQPLLADGRAQDITVTTSRPGNGRLWLFIRVVDTSGQVEHFKHPVKVL
ncbi:phage GP46 family protein [Chromobacterium subtsugae]|uniref:phage GP46 family protein n=1 Tax=Chromobacterium subtsugae TaxID=251747 RepID=UPI0006416871|nr:phage GP46 family protein [Chromobacterium subtsugae]